MLDITTPALLFPALSLLMLAYTNRFITLANLIRKLHGDYIDSRSPMVMSQIENLRKRILLIKVMQIFGVGSLLLCVLCMFLIFFDLITASNLVFALSLTAMIISLFYSLWELFISVNALKLQLSDLQDGCEDPDT